jgi:hypothetical protein
MIGDAKVLARQHNIAGLLRPSRLNAAAVLDKGQIIKRLAQMLARGIQRQAPGKALALGYVFRLLLRPQGLAAIGKAKAVRRAANIGGDRLAGLETAIDQAAFAQLVQGGVIVAHMLRLNPHGCFPVEVQPSEVIINGLGKFRGATGLIYVLYAQDEAAMSVFCVVIGIKRAEGVSKMEPAGRRGGEPGPDRHRTLGLGLALTEHAKMAEHAGQEGLLAAHLGLEGIELFKANHFG